MTQPSRARIATSGRIAVLAATSLAAAGIILAALGRSAPKPAPLPAREAGGAHKLVALFAETVPAANKPHLALAVDDRKVLGWISGDASYAGRAVTVTAGDCTQAVPLQANNTFTWYYRVAEPTAAEFAVDKLRRRVTLHPPAKVEPSAFFVVDRTVYRPGHELHFAAFLREPDRGGRFRPLGAVKVEVLLRSMKKKAVAAKRKLTSDDFGRVVGSYRFSAADALDEYTLSIKGYRGQAVVKLAEFRKAKVRLDISGERKGKKLRLRFEARDFLDKPVPAERVRFTAKVFRRPTLEQDRPLNADEFVYPPDWPDWMPAPDELTGEQLDRWLQHGVLPRRNYLLAAQVSQDIHLGGEPRATHDLTLQDGWLDGRSVVQVEGVLVDENGREQRATRTLRLGAADAPKGRRLVIDLPKRLFGAREPIAAGVRLIDADGKAAALPADTVVVLMRSIYQPAYWPASVVYNSPFLSAQAVPRWRLAQVYSHAGYHHWPYRYPPPRYWPHHVPHAAGWTTYRPEQRLTGELVAAVPVRGGRASIAADTPGTYELVAVTRLADGTPLRRRAHCTVVAEHGRGLLLRMDRTQYQAGQTVSGEIHSRFRGARLLLTLRDSRGLRLWRRLRLDGAVARFRQRLPKDLNYGCALAVQYVDEAGRRHVSQRELRVTPTDRLLEIETDMEEVVEPGSKMKIALRVNRAEPVDLVVSVYDQSLLGVARDRNPDVRSFYLADERAFCQGAWDVLRRKLADLTLDDLAERARRMLKQNLSSPEAKSAKTIITWCNASSLPLESVVRLLDFAGVACRRCLPGRGGWYCSMKRDGKKVRRLVDLLRQEHNQWRLTCRLYDDIIVFAQTHPTARQSPGAYGAYYPLYSQRFAARGDAHYSLSANSMMSVSGQSFISHLPAAADMPAEMLQPDTPAGKGAVRRDFSDSAFWNARLRTNERGRAEVAFKLPDSLTNWQVVVTGVSADMRVGRHAASFRTYKPIMVWPMIPRIFTQGDKVRLFARVHNRTDRPQSIRTRLKVQNGQVVGRDTAVVTVPPTDSRCVYWTFAPGEAGYTQLLMTAECDDGADASLKRLPVVPACSVAQHVTASGFCRDEAVFNVPREALRQETKLEITLAPSLAADMLDSLDYLVNYPYGCVEQTMSRFLPAIKVAQILRKMGLRPKSLEKKLPDCVARGIKRLMMLQHKDGGWGWSGSSATHEMMTPYALYGLLEAERAGYALPADEPVSRGLARLKQFIDQMGKSAASDRIYCMYVYSLRKKMQAEWWSFIEREAAARRLSDYATALALEMAVRDGKKALADKLAARLRARAQRSGGQVLWTTAGFSRWGDSPLEITAAALKAIVAYDANDPLIPGILAYFTARKCGKRWNSTKSTALILFALCDYIARKDLHLRKGSTVYVRVNGGRPYKAVLNGGKAKTLTVDADEVRAGKNTVRFSNAAFGTMYRLVFHYRKNGRDVPAFAGGASVTRRFYLHDKSGKCVREVKPGAAVPRGSYLVSDVVVRRTGSSSMSYVLVDSPKPSCCEIVPVDDKRFGQTNSGYVLREERTGGVLHHYENAGSGIGNRCVFYAELAGEYVVPPAYAELMYKPDVRGHSGTFRFRVEEREVVSGE